MKELPEIKYNPTYEDCLMYGWKNGEKNVIMAQAEHSNEVDIWCFSLDDFGGKKPPYTFIVKTPYWKGKELCEKNKS